MKALFITMSVVLVAAAAGIGVLAVSPAPERPDSLTLVIETGSIATTTASTQDPAGATTSALGTQAPQADAGKREQTLDEVIAARLREAKRPEQGEDTARLRRTAEPEDAGSAETAAPGMAVVTQPEETDFAAPEQAPAPSGTISITQMLAAELSDDSAQEPGQTQARASDRPSASGEATPMQAEPVRRAETAPAPSDAAAPPIEFAALDPRAGDDAISAPAEPPAADSAAIGETPDQLIADEPAVTEQRAPEPRGAPLAAGEAPPAPAQRGRFRVKGRIALVIRGLGVNPDLTARTIEAMPRQVALGFVPYGEGLEEWTRKARRGSHDVLIQVPLEPKNYPETNPGPHTLLTSLSIDENLSRLDWLLDRFEGITGVSNYLGGKFAASPGALAPVLMELKARDLIYVDDGKAANPTARQLARQISLSYAVADSVIDEGDRSQEAVARALEQVEALARSEGKAIVIGHAHTGTLDTLGNWIAGLSKKGLVLESIGALLAAPPERQVSQTTDG